MDHFDRLRRNMTENQIRPSDVSRSDLIAAMAEIPRELFVPKTRRALAYVETHVPLLAEEDGPPRYLLAPPLFARMADAAGIAGADLILDVGCASGYSTAILSRLAPQGAVLGLEENAALSAIAVRTLAHLGLDNAAIITGALGEGCPKQGPYDVIFLNGAIPSPPRPLLSQLKEGGRLIAPLARAGAGQVRIFTKQNSAAPDRIAFDADAPPLPGFDENQDAFVFSPHAPADLQGLVS